MSMFPVVTPGDPIVVQVFEGIAGPTIDGINAAGPGAAIVGNTVLAEQGSQHGPGMNSWHRGIAASLAGTAPLVVVTPADSEVELADCFSYVRSRLKAKLQPSNRQPDSTNTPAWKAAAGFASLFGIQWTHTGTVTIVGGDTDDITSTNWLGLTGQVLQLADGATCTLNGSANPSGARCTEYMFRWEAGASGSSLDLKIDGTTVHTVSNAAVRGHYTATGLSAGLHIPSVVSHGVTKFDGGYSYWGDYSSGLQWWDIGRAGLAVHHIINNSTLFTSLTEINPHLIINEMGGNDFRLLRTADQTHDDLVTLINMEKTAVSDVSLMQIQWNGLALVPTYNSAFRDLHRAISLAFNIPFVDVGKVMPVMVQSGGTGPDVPYGYTSDGSHYSPLGQSVVGRLVLGRLFGGDFIDGVVTLLSSNISDFDTQVRTSRVDQLLEPNAAVFWDIGSFKIGDGTGGDGTTEILSINIGIPATGLNLTQGSEAAVLSILNGSGRIGFGTSADWLIAHTSSALSTMTGVLKGAIAAVVSANKTTSYTAVAGDVGSVIPMNGSGITFTIPTNAAVPFVIGAFIEVTNLHSTALTLAIAGSDTFITGSTLTLGQGKTAKFRKLTATTWSISISS